MNEDIRFIRKKIFSISDLDLKQRIILFFKEHQIQISSNNSSSL